MNHVGTITKTTAVAKREFHAQCSCGTAGDFAAKEGAIGYLQGHFGKLRGIATSELVDNTVVKSAPAASHAAPASSGPPPPPPPPDAK